MEVCILKGFYFPYYSLFILGNQAMLTRDKT